MPLQLNTTPDFWKDIKFLQKHTKKKELKPYFNDGEFNNLDDAGKISCIPYINAIKNYIENSLTNLDGISDKYDRQPFLTYGWTIRKLRYAIDSNQGKSKGARLIFCINSNNLLFVYINIKKFCADERKLENEFMTRIKNYILL